MALLEIKLTKKNVADLKPILDKVAARRKANASLPWGEKASYIVVGQVKVDECSINKCILKVTYLENDEARIVNDAVAKAVRMESYVRREGSVE